MKPIWKRSPSEVTAEEYTEFYKHVSHDWTEPLKTIHFRAEGTFEYEALLYIPSKAPWDLYYVGSEMGLRLFARRVMIMEKCEDLCRTTSASCEVLWMPGSSAQHLAPAPPAGSPHQPHQETPHGQSAGHFQRPARQGIRQVPHQLWTEFGRAIKEGVGADYDNRDKIVPLLLFASSNDPEKLTSVKDYVERMKSGQERILYMTGESRVMIENSPHIEAAKAKGYEVLYMMDPVDELVLQHFTEFESKKLKSVGKGEIELGTEEEKQEAQKELKSKEEEFRPLIEFLQTKLADHVKQVRLSSRLTTSPACLVVDEHEYSPMLERALKKSGAGEAPEHKRVMELNPKHPLIERMKRRRRLRRTTRC